MKPSLLSDITNRFTPISDTPALDASVLIGHIINKPRTWVLAHPEFTLTTEQQQQLDDSLARLERGESFPYILGHWEFFGLEFDVTPDVLIPRPETELLVEKAIARLQEFPIKRSIADVGTGSGAIAVSIAVNVPGVNILATEISPKALQVAKQNAKKHGVSKSIDFIECDLLPARDSLSNPSIDLLCANLPYIPTQTLYSLSIFGHEPSLALDGGPDGLDLYRRLFSLVPEWLASDAKLLLEIEATQGAKILALANHIFDHAEIRLYRDLSGHDRLLEMTLSGT
jgi:release factor glutamine methyltransferase